MRDGRKKAQLATISELARARVYDAVTLPRRLRGGGYRPEYFVTLGMKERGWPALTRPVGCGVVRSTLLRSSALFAFYTAREALTVQYKPSQHYRSFIGLLILTTLYRYKCWPFDIRIFLVLLLYREWGKTNRSSVPSPRFKHLFESYKMYADRTSVKGLINLWS